MKKIILTKLAKENGAQYEEAHEAMEAFDGFHTFDDLYDHRVTLFIALCRSISGRQNSGIPLIWRTKVHHDGSTWDGWFMLAIGKEPGKQITYHLPMSRWEETDFAQTFDKAPVEFDGHTSADVLERLKSL